MEHNTVLNNFIVLERIFKLNAWNSDVCTKELFLEGDVPNRTRQDLTEHRRRIRKILNLV